jgi:hypothetical protein
LFFVSLLATACRNDSMEEYIECDDGCKLLSELYDKTDYVLPMTLFNDLGREIKKLILNDKVLDLPFGASMKLEKSGFYELIIQYEDEYTPDKTILFTLVSKEREAAEWGIEEWIPEAFTTSSLASETVNVFYPRYYVEGCSLPIVFYTMENDHIAPLYTDATYTETNRTFFIKRGVGSISLSPEEITDALSFDIGGRPVDVPVQSSQQTTVLLSGEITDNLTIETNSLVKITGDLHLGSGVSLTVNPGAVILVDEGINVSNEGAIYFNGVPDNPILVTCSASGMYWGGFLSSGTGAIINSNYTFFCQSGYHQGTYDHWGHAKWQALFRIEQSALTLNHCFILDNLGQIFYPVNATLNFESILVQRARTGGQINYSTLSIHNSIFTDFPDDSQVYQDHDNDAIYINASDVTVDSCTFMFAKDDGFDSGLDEGGTVTISNARFEACFHEGAALSSGGEVTKNHSFRNCIFTNCGQGVELGFSSPNHTVRAEDCLFLNNYIGIRYGDNYDWSGVYGQMYIKNSLSLNNGKDVWNMIRKIWAPRIDHMHFDNVKVSALVPQYPDLEIYSE